MVRRRYEWSWLYTAIEPTSGEDFCLYLSALDGVCFEVFLQHLGERFAGEVIVLVLDNAPAHRWKDARVPENVVLVRLPAYSPELNPVERLFLAGQSGLLRKAMSKGNPGSEIEFMPVSKAFLGFSVHHASSSHACLEPHRSRPCR